MYDDKHSYDRKYNVGTATGWSLYVDTMEEVRELAEKHGPHRYVDEGYADHNYHDTGFDSQIEEVVRRTTRRVPESEYA